MAHVPVAGRGPFRFSPEVGHDYAKPEPVPESDALDPVAEPDAHAAGPAVAAPAPAVSPSAAERLMT